MFTKWTSNKTWTRFWIKKSTFQKLTQIPLGFDVSVKKWWLPLLSLLSNMVKLFFNWKTHLSFLSCLCVCSGAAFWWAGATPLSRYSGGGGGQGHFNSPYSWTPLFRGCILVSKGNPTLQIFGGRRRAGDGILLTRLQFRLVRVKVCEHLKRQCHGYSMHWDPSGYCLAVKAENKKDIWEYYTV